MAASVLYLKKVYDINPKSDGSELFGGKTDANDNRLTAAARKGRCRVFELWCHLEDFAKWIIDHWNTIEGYCLDLEM